MQNIQRQISVGKLNLAIVPVPNMNIKWKRLATLIKKLSVTQGSIIR